MFSLEALPTSRLNRNVIMKELIARSFKQPGVRQRLCGDTPGLLAQVLGVHVPTGLEIHVHEESPEEIHLVIPAPDAERDKVRATITEERLRALFVHHDPLGTAALESLPHPREVDESRLTRGSIEGNLMVRAASDASFRAELMADPGKVVARELGIPIPPECAIQVHQESASELHLVVPTNPDVPGELREAVRPEPLRALVYSCIDQCLTAAATACGTCTLVSYCTDDCLFDQP